MKNTGFHSVEPTGQLQDTGIDLFGCCLEHVEALARAYDGVLIALSKAYRHKLLEHHSRPFVFTVPLKRQIALQSLQGLLWYSQVMFFLDKFIIQHVVRPLQTF